MTDFIMYRKHYRTTPQSRKVMSIMLRDGGITHLTAQHYGIACVTKEIQRVREASPVGYAIKTVRRKDAEGNKYTRWTLSKVA